VGPVARKNPRRREVVEHQLRLRLLLPSVHTFISQKVSYMCRVRSPAVSTESNLRPCGSPLRPSDQSGFASFWSVESPSEFLRPVLFSFVHRVSSSLSSPVDPSFRALSGRLKLTVRRHTSNKDSLLTSVFH
jgi:hypothetical protein